MRFFLSFSNALYLAALFTRAAILAEVSILRREFQKGRFGLTTLFRPITVAWFLLELLFRRNRASKTVAAKRMATCRRCPVYSHRLMTCGQAVPDDGLGCKCFMPLKSLHRYADCWAREAGLSSYGWSEKLRPWG